MSPESEKFSNEIAMSAHICHFSPGTSKWNKIRISDVLFYNQELAKQTAGQYRNNAVNFISDTATKSGRDAEADILRSVIRK